MTNCDKTEKKHEFSYACRAFPYRQCSSTPSLGSVKRPPGSSAGDGTPSVLHDPVIEPRTGRCDKWTSTVMTICHSL